jgi:hypothetical protein
LVALITGVQLFLAGFLAELSVMQTQKQEYLIEKTIGQPPSPDAQ